MDSVYVVTRANRKCELCRWDRDGRYLIRPERSQKLRTHSPDGFEFGYSGSGPSQLALAILLDALDNDLAALDNYQAFKVAFVARDLPRLEISKRAILHWLAKQSGAGVSSEAT